MGIRKGIMKAKFEIFGVKPGNDGQQVQQIFRRLFWLPTLLIGVFGNSLTASAANCDPPPANIVGWWAGDGNASDQTGANNGTLQSSATATGTGMVGQCFTFNGSSAYVSIPDSAGLHPTNFTVEAWVEFSSLDSTASGNSPAGSQYIVFKQNSQTYNFEGIALCKYRTSSGDVFKLTVTSASAQSASVSSTTTISTNVWYHIAAIRNGSTLQLYVNGQLQAQTSVSFAQNYGTLPLYFGTSGQSYWDHKFAGNLDEVTLYSRALASNEISAIYAAGSAGKCKTASPPAIATQPQSQTVTVGGSANFNVTASGTAPLNYQWRFNGTAMSGATSTALSLANVQTSQGGNYSVVVTNAVGSLTSAVAVLTVTTGGTAPTITTQPSSQTVVAGGNATFSVAASGTAPLKYQWTFGGSKLSGATNASLTLSGAQSGNAGTYAVVVTNNYGSITSSGATLTVTSAAGMVTDTGVV